MSVWDQLVRETTERKHRRPPAECATARIVEYISQHPGCTAADIREALDLDAAPMQDKLCALERQGRIWSRVDEVKNRRPHAGRYAKHFWSIQ